MGKTGFSSGIWIQLEAENPREAAAWFCKEMWFSPAGDDGQTIRVQNGNCRLAIAQKYRTAISYAPGTCFAGYEHIALETPDIAAALRYCRKRGMVLESDGDGPRYNPKVWGDGMYYFNILTDFGVKVEVSQRLASPAPEGGCDRLITGLEHIGIEVSDIGRSIAYYMQMGCSTGWPKVENSTDEGPVFCTMLEAGDAMLEIYQFTEKSAYQPNVNSGLQGLILDGGGTRSDRRLAVGPDGEYAAIF